MRGGSRSNNNTDLPRAPKQPGRDSAVLSALAAQDLGVYLVGAGIEQIHCTILQRP